MKQITLWIALLALIVMALGAIACGGDDDDDDDDDDDTDDDQGVADGYPIADTDQTDCYDNGSRISCPTAGEAFYGQDAQYDGNVPAYQDNGDGTVTDLVTGLMWTQDAGEKMQYDEAVAALDDVNTGGYDDWRVPTIKELYSLFLFSGIDPSSYENDDTSGLIPFIDDTVFDFAYGDPSADERIIDSQWVTSSVYTDSVMGGNECFFGVNFADGRIKCYPTQMTNSQGYFARYVRGNADYGKNDFVDNGDGTVTDNATGLMWQQGDSGTAMLWEAALDHCETLDEAGHNDWRLPNAKELQSIVDYDRSPGATDSAAIDPVFDITPMTNEAGQDDYPWFWASNTHEQYASDIAYSQAAYVCFGRAMGYWNGEWQDVHGAGAQRSDRKTGDPDDYPEGSGPQGDAVRIANYVRCVRGMGDLSGEAGQTGDDDDDSSQGDDDDDDQSPPDDAVDACDGKQAGDGCSFEGMGGETVNGTCEQIGEDLACVPADGPPSE